MPRLRKSCVIRIAMRTQSLVGEDSTKNTEIAIRSGITTKYLSVCDNTLNVGNTHLGK
ncbi:hypothetical protein GCM10025791_13630 [Halioxenophilus aromaticivorans]|uniref:Uncharacterized protein n=1 Tax=Halioxenophilus aromaticivorans TaxID=1306992 RepID=A0AAV3TZW2_9ALTE